VRHVFDSRSILPDVVPTPYLDPFRMLEIWYSVQFSKKDGIDEEESFYGRTNGVCTSSGGIGVSVTEVCRKLGVAEQTFYRWKKKFGGMGVAELRKLRQLEDENKRLKQLVADLSLDKSMLQDVLSKKL